MYHIAVLGPIPRDHITTHTGEIIEKYGGVNNPVIAISRLLEDQGRVYPVTHVRKSDHGPINDILKEYENVNLDFIRSDADMGDIISLTFVDQNKRLEKQTGIMNPIVPADVAGILHCDVFVCVPITDYEVPLETVKYLKEKGKGVVIFDAHGPTTACLVNGERQRKFWIDRDLWLPYIDVLKMNLEEAQASWFKKEYESQDFGHNEEPNREELRAFALHCLGKGVKCVYITVDSRGCLVYYMEKGKLKEELVPPIKVDTVIDTTGCGDSFAGGVGYGLMQKPKDYIGAARFGNALGALRTQGKTFAVFKSLSETEKIIKQGYIRAN